MSAFKGATSLVDLILKKFGDDTAGAAKELERLGGFPESVSQRIATGELPMDEASRLARASEQGYGGVLYRGINGEYDPAKAGRYQMFTSSSQDAAEYGDNVIEARLNLGNSIEVDGRGRNFNNIYVGDLPSNLFDRLHGSERESLIARTDDLSHAANKAGNDSLIIKNIYDKADNEIPKRPAANTTGPSDEEIMRELGLDYSPSPSASPAPDARNYDPVDVSVIYDPSRIRSPNAAFDPQYSGPNIMGGLALPVTAGLLAAGQSEDADAGFVTRGGKTLLEAFHGSPHKFDRFSMDQIGTGEGVQQYGHGLYFADDIDTAKGFQPRDPDHEEWIYGQYKAAEEAGDQYMMDAWERAMMHDSPIELRASAADPDYDEYSQAAFAEVADALSANPSTGSLSRAEIDVTPESLLDYDKPLKEQSELVQNFFVGREGITPDTHGRDLAESLLKGREPGLGLKKLSAIASREMNEGGIRGLQYQDWVNRAEGSDLRNYVIFDDSLINIAERGNADPRLLAGTAAGTAGLLAAPALVKDGVFQHSATKEPVVERREPVNNQSSLLEGATGFADDVFANFKNAAGPVGSLLMPFEGVNDYLKVVNDNDKQPTWWDRLGLLDL